MLRESYPLYLAGEPLTGGAELVVTNKYTLRPAVRVARADAETIAEKTRRYWRHTS